MTSKTLTGTYSGGYSIATGVTALTVTATGYIEGVGVTTTAGETATYSVTNSGRILSGYGSAALADHDGVYFGHGGKGVRRTW